VRRLGGYRTFVTAYARELLRDARPLDEVSVNAMPDGIHDCTIGEVEHGLAHARVRFDGRAGRRVWARLTAEDVRTARLVELLDSGMPDPGEWRHLAADVLGAAARVRVEASGDVDVLICPDRSYVITSGGGEIRAQLNDHEEVTQWLSTHSVNRRRPRVVEILAVTTSAR
jgi:hypothetical protein